MWSIWKLCRAHKSAERAMRDSFNSSFPFPTQIINRKVVEMSMGMTNLINFDFCAYFIFFSQHFWQIMNMTKIFPYLLLTRVRGRQTKGEIAQLGLSPCELWNLFEIGLRNKQIKIYMKYNLEIRRMINCAFCIILSSFFFFSYYNYCFCFDVLFCSCSTLPLLLPAVI